MQILGFLNKRLNPETLKLESSRSLELYSHLCIILRMAHCIRFPVSLLWRREDTANFFLGSYFNYLDDEPR